MIPSVPATSKSQRQLLKLFSSLDEDNQKHVVAFMEFLASKEQSTGPGQSSAVLEEPVIEPRPESESVIAAIKRLSRGYSMLNKDDMLHETSDLMTSHVIKGRPAVEVIDELEILFLRHYEKRVQRDRDD